MGKYLNSTGLQRVWEKVKSYVAPQRRFIGTCTSAANTQNKEATVDNDFVLVKGVVVAIKFSYTNTYSSTAAAPVTLNVNNTGAYRIYYSTSNAYTGTNASAYGTADRYIYYMFDGTQWLWLSHGADANTTYTNMSAAEITAGTVTTGRVVSAKTLNDWVLTKTQYDAIVSDAGDGTYTTLKAAVVAGKKRILVKAGTYDWDASCAVFATNGVVIEGESREGVIINVSSGDYMLKGDTGYGVTLRNLTIKTPANGKGIYKGQSPADNALKGLEIDGCDIVNNSVYPVVNVIGNAGRGMEYLDIHDCSIYQAEDNGVVWSTGDKWYGKVKVINNVIRHQKPSTSQRTVAITMNALGKGTYSSPYNLDFTDSGLDKVQICSSWANGNLSPMSVNKVPANTGIYIEGTAGATYNIPIVDHMDAVYANIFKGVTESRVVAATEDGKLNYYFSSSGSSGAGWYRASGSITIGDNRCYLSAPQTSTPKGGGWPSSVTIYMDSGHLEKLYCSPYNLDFTDIEGIEAHVCVGYVDGRPMLSRVRRVQAGTGIYLTASDGSGNYTIPVASDTVYENHANLFVGVLTATDVAAESGNKVNLVMNSSGDFVKIDGTESIPANSAYLQLPAHDFIKMEQNDFGSVPEGEQYVVNNPGVEESVEEVSDTVTLENGDRLEDAILNANIRTIYLKPGSYYLEPQWNYEYNRLGYHKDNLTIIGLGDDPRDCKITLYEEYGEEPTFEGNGDGSFILKNLTTEGGGRLEIYSYSKIVIDSCIMDGYNGLGLINIQDYSSSSGSLYVNNCIFKSSYGALSISSNYYCVITNNSISSIESYHGSKYAISGGHGILRNNTFIVREDGSGNPMIASGFTDDVVGTKYGEVNHISIYT